jgi:hypothetical protein
VEIRSGFRTIDVTPQLVIKLQEYKEKQQMMKEGFGEQYHHELDLVFPKYDEGIQNPSAVRAKF